MSEHFNYGPVLSFQQIGQKGRGSNEASEYLYPTAVATDSTTSSSLGAHWKKVEAVVKRVVNEVDPPSAPSPPTTGSSASSSTSSTVPVTVTVTPVSCAARWKCLSAQERGLVDLLVVLSRVTDRVDTMYERTKTTFARLETSAEQYWSRMREHVTYRDEELNDKMDGLEELGRLLGEQLGLLRVFDAKRECESFVRRVEPFFEHNERTIDFLDENRRRAASVGSWLAEHKKGSEARQLTEFEHENPRVETVYGALKTMIAEHLRLEPGERAYMSACIAKLDAASTSQFGAKFKCEQVMRHLLAMMSKWDRRGGSASTTTTTSMGSVLSSFPSVGSVVESSSFALSALTNNDDSNLTDLEAELRSARIRKAVDTGMPSTRRIVASPWPTSSCSFSSAGLTSIQSMNEPWTLSSYEPISSSIGPSSTETDTSSTSSSSVSAALFSMPTQSSHSSGSGCVMKTAHSKEDGVVSARGARTSSSRLLLDDDAHSKERTDSIGSLNFSSVSLGEMVDDALHTARDAAETQAHNLMEALQCSASKCGVAISDLMTAVSSSSESLSDTQASHSSSITH